MNTRKNFSLLFGGLTVIYLAVSISSKLNAESLNTELIIQKQVIDWEAFDSASTTPKDKIRPENIQGLWLAYEGAYRFGKVTNIMELTKPFIIEVKDDVYRRSSTSKFVKFYLENNLIIKKDVAKIDTGFINKITASELTISWKSSSNYTRYYYRK